MIDINTPIRTAIRTALQGYVTYAATTVNVYSEQNFQDESLFILLTTQTEADDSDKTKHNTKATIVIDIVHEAVQGVTYDVVDNVAGQVMGLMQPSRTTTGLTNPTGLQILNLKRLSSNTLTIPNADKNIMRRLLRYEMTIIEN